MKISLAWLLDHILVNTNAPEITITRLMERFNQVTAEIEGFTKVELPLDAISLAQVRDLQSDAVTLYSAEWDISCTLSPRKDCVLGDYVLIYRENGETGTEYRWVTMADVGSEKEGLMPAVSVESENAYKGGWKQTVEKVDYILDVDNKSLTHRPDMWGHRGFAREVAALFDASLKPLSAFMVEVPEQNLGATQAKRTVTIQDAACDRFAGLSVSAVENKPSLLWMALRLARIDARPIRALVDFTNYVMFDITQPMHAFDADLFKHTEIIVRKAQNKERLTLLDGETIELTSDDLVVCDGTQPAALAGVMGGQVTAVNARTKNLFLEAAHFDPTTIRLTAARHKKRTEASARFEKNIDPDHNAHALIRFLKLCDDASISYTVSGTLISLGKRTQSRIIEIGHAFIERRLGVSLDTAFVVDTLRKLEFSVERILINGGEGYRVTVPSFRATKDVQIPEDIVEEVGRFYGYAQIPLVLPAFQLEAKDMNALARMRAIKRLLADGCAMRELYTYAFFDEAFLRRISWEPASSLSVQNSVSENWQRLVTSLIPNMIKAVEAEAAERDQLAFFEVARIWHAMGQEAHEKEVLSGIMFDKKNPVNFYDIKGIVQKILEVLPVEVSWEKVDSPQDPWFAPYETARIMSSDGVCIGTVGIVPTSFLHHVTEGYAGVFELDAAFLAAYKPALVRYKPASKYPIVQRDISMLVPLDMTVEEVVNMVSRTDARIIDVALIDFFEKKEWLDKRSLTVRFALSDHEKTLKKEEVDAVWQGIVTQLTRRGVSIR